MRPDPEPIFYVDEDLDSDDFVNPLIEAGFAIKRHRDHFAPGTPDEQWLPAVAQKGWYAFSHNSEIYYTKTQTNIVLEQGLGLFIVRGKSKERSHQIMGENTANTKVRIYRFIKKNYRPFIASVRNPDKRSGKGKVVGLRPVDREWNKGKMERRRKNR